MFLLLCPVSLSPCRAAHVSPIVFCTPPAAAEAIRSVQPVSRSAAGHADSVDRLRAAIATAFPLTRPSPCPGPVTHTPADACRGRAPDTAEHDTPPRPASGLPAARLLTSHARSSPHPSALFRPCLRRSILSKPPPAASGGGFDGTKRAGTRSDGRKQGRTAIAGVVRTGRQR